ncbi:MAG: aquaporin [Saprospiraceae bacterium]|nr:aquaporin [Saprospiraceae bacterium]
MKLNKLLVECMGTFFLVLIINISALGTQTSMVPWVMGLTLAAMTYAGGHISGAHFNPAVTIAVFIRGKCSAADVPSYIFAQLLGAAVAALAAGVFFTGKVGQGMDLSVTALQAVFSEILGTFAMTWVFLNVASSKDTIGNSYYGLAIGMVVAALALVFGPLSGGAFNPAIALSYGINNISGFNNFWIYLVGETIGAIAAAYVFLLTNGKD